MFYTIKNSNNYDLIIIILIKKGFTYAKKNNKKSFIRIIVMF